MSEEDDELTGSSTTLELFFVVLVGIAFGAAFIAAMTYDFVSARTPMVILAPLLLLIAAQFNRTRKAIDTASATSEFSRVVKGKNKKFNSAAGLAGWTVLLMLLIFLAGHYIGIATFMYILLNVISKESKILSASVSAGVTAIIYVLFEHGFNIEMYRGLLYNFLSGYFIA